MIHDLIGVKQEDYQNLIDNLSLAITDKGGFWRHVERSVYSSASVKLDKYIFSVLKSYIEAKKPLQGAFAKKSIKQLLDVHKANRYVLVTDVHHYFDSIRYAIVTNSMDDCFNPTEWTGLIESFYFTPEGGLKRGLKSSPLISELIGLKIDALINTEIHKLEKPFAEYSRYYDDIVISSNDENVLKQIQVIIENELSNKLGLHLNHKKTRLVPSQSAVILGLRIHNSKITVPKVFRKKIRVLEYKYRRSLHDEDSLDGIHDAKSEVGTIIGSIRYYLDNTDERYPKLEDELAKYYGELERLEEIRIELVEDGAEYED